MEASAAREVIWSQLSELIARKLGLHFPPERCGDLQRGLAGAAKELGFADIEACAAWLVSADLSKAQVQTLASHLTIGETYFFRGKKTFDVLAESVLPELIRARETDRRLRIWSAACCTGEEPYSLAILLQQLIPGWAGWRITILATDINERFLRHAAAGVYGEWSFRETPDSFKDRYFLRTPEGRYAIQPEIKKAVTFAPLNLVDDLFPALATDTNAMDLIFCRNVLMYFAPEQARKVAGRLRRALVDDGWLAVSPGEGTQVLPAELQPVYFPGVILYQKRGAKPPSVPAWPEAPATPLPVAELPSPPSWPLPPATPPAADPIPPKRAPTPLAAASSLYQQGRCADAVETLLSSLAPGEKPAPPALSLLTRAFANLGRLAEALTWCNRWIASDKLDGAAYYLKAVVLQELGQIEEARRALQRAIYLGPDFVLAHFALGNLARAGGKKEEAAKHFDNAQHLLAARPPEELLPESDGLTAGRLTEIIASVLTLEAKR
jgi:chemotaxis protein methyltransferase CheR